MRPTENQLNSFEDWYDSDEYQEYSRRWSEPSLDIMKYAWICRMNCTWVNKMFELCNHVEVLKHTIKKCKMYLNDLERFSENDEYSIRRIHSDCKRELYRRLMLLIDEYCLD